MSLALGCIADDYTGATDLANTLTRNGLRTLQVQGPPAADAALPDVDAIVVALKSRTAAPARAAALACEANDWLRQRGASHVMFKICSTFDSTDHGNIGPVIDSLRARHGGALMPVTPAFPGTGRTVYNGHLFVGRTLLSESPLRDHPLNPMRDSNLMRLLERQATSKIELAAFDVVDAGPEALAEKLKRLAASGAGGVIIDALCERHLVAIGSAVWRNPISTGASGLGLGLARAFVAAGRAGDAGAAAETPPAAGKAAMIAGSCSRATLEQIAETEKRLPVLRLDPGELCADPQGAVDHAVAWSATFLKQDNAFLIATSAEPDAVESVQSKYGREKAAHTIENVLASIAKELAARGVRKLVVAGGETSGAVVDRLGVKAFLIGAEVAPGVPVVHTHAADERMSLVLKSGNFGAVTFFTDALKAINA